MSFCTECGQKIVEGAKFCTECGTRVYDESEGAHKSFSDFEEYKGKIKICQHCGDAMPEDAFYCLNCGSTFPDQQIEFEVINQKIKMQTGTWRNKWIAFFLCLFFGWAGAHRFYEGKNFTGLVYLFTWGLFGIGWIIDIIRIATKPNPYRAK